MRSFFASRAMAALHVIVLPTVSAVGGTKESSDIFKEILWLRQEDSRGFAVVT